MSHAGPSARDVAAFTSLSVAARKPRATSVRRSFLLWTAVEQKKQRSYASERPYEAHLLEAERALARGDALLIAAQADIEKDLKRTFPSLQGYGMLSEGATRNVLIAHAQRNPAVGYCQSLNYVCAALLMVPLSEEDAFFSLCTVVEDLMPPDYYTRENDILGARVDQLVYSTLLGSRLPRLAGHLLDLGCPISLFSIQWFMCLYSKVVHTHAMHMRNNCPQVLCTSPCTGAGLASSVHMCMHWYRDWYWDWDWDWDWDWYWDWCGTASGMHMRMHTCRTYPWT